MGAMREGGNGMIGQTHAFAVAVGLKEIERNREGTRRVGRQVDVAQGEAGGSGQERRGEASGSERRAGRRVDAA
jgi:hypothetical protein